MSVIFRLRLLFSLRNSAIIFDSRVWGQVLGFGVTARLSIADLVMYDRQKFTWWQQALCQWIMSGLISTQLTVFPTWMENFSDFQACNPAGVFINEPKYFGNYGNIPYRWYYSSTHPSLLNGDLPHRIEPLACLVRVKNYACPLSRFSGGVREKKEARM